MNFKPLHLRERHDVAFFEEVRAFNHVELVNGGVIISFEPCDVYGVFAGPRFPEIIQL